MPSGVLISCATPATSHLLGMHQLVLRLLQAGQRHLQLAIAAVQRFRALPHARFQLAVEQFDLDFMLLGFGHVAGGADHA
jgi:hypothetical protein